LTLGEPMFAPGSHGTSSGAERSPGIRSRTRPHDRGRVGEAGYVAGNSPFSSLR
jgi:hypothetical protein